MELGGSEKALLDGCQIYVNEVIDGKHSEIQGLSPEKIATLITFGHLIRRILREGKMSEARGSRLSDLLDEVRKILHFSPMARSWFAGIRSFLTYKVVEEMKRKQVARKTRSGPTREFRTKFQKPMEDK